MMPYCQGRTIFRHRFFAQVHLKLGSRILSNYKTRAVDNLESVLDPHLAGLSTSTQDPMSIVSEGMTPKAKAITSRLQVFRIRYQCHCRCDRSPCYR
jgi:hypothetical protein